LSRRLRRPVAGVLALCLAAALAGCGGGDGGGEAQEGPNNPFFGVITGEPLPGTDQLSQLGDAGAGTLRINLAWGYVQSAPNAKYDWRHYDGLVGEAARNGIRVLATVYGSAPWAEPTPEHAPLGRMLLPFGAFVRAAVERYGSHGSFWRRHPDVPELPILDWEAWNEPNFALFWKPEPDPAAYLQLLRVFHGAVKAADPRAQVLLGGLFPTPKDGVFLDDFITSLYQGGARDLFDAASVHPYAANPEKAIGATADMRSLMDRFGDSSKPIWITEVGWASGGAPSGLTVGPERQADYLKRIFELAQDRRRQLGIAGVVWYSLEDSPGPLWVGHCGLFELDGSTKPAWDEFVSVAGGTD
jgi:hypothetical protein